MEEIWKDIDGTNGQYQISNLGRVMSNFRYLYDINTKKCKKIMQPKLLNMQKNKKGYLLVSIYIKGKLKTFRVHKLEAETFLDKKDFKSMPYEDRNNIDLNKLQVNHIDTCKTNNKITNLEFCTNEYNHYHAEINCKNTVPRKKVILYNENETLNFVSINKALKFVNVTKSGKYKKYINTNKRYKNYYWKYKEEE